MPPPRKNRSHVPAEAGQNRPPPRQPKRRMASRDAAERAAFFARREAAAVLRRVLRGDASRRAAASIKSLVYSPSVRNKRATFALVCQTLKFLPIIKEVLTSSGVLTGKWKKQEELVYVTAYDILFGQEIAVSGSVEQLLMLHKDFLKTALEKICVRRKVSSVEELLSKNTTVKPKPRFLRVNTLKLKTTTESVIEELNKIHKVVKDDMVPDMLVLPPGTDLHNHPLVTVGKVFLQGKASCMVAVALCPKPRWKDILQTAANLKLRKWKGNENCILCGVLEDSNHIFFNCVLAKFACLCVKELLDWKKIPKSLDDFHQFWLDGRGANNYQTVLFSFAAMVWTLWKVRNEMAIEKTFPKQPIQVIFKSLSCLQKWRLLIKKEDRENVDGLIRRADGWLKTFDATPAV